jgi:hypothetical protein
MATEPPVPPNGAASPPPPDGPQQQPKGHISPASLAAQRNLRVAQAGAPSVSGLEALVNVSEPVRLWLSDGVSIVADSRDAERLIREHGFRRTPADLEELGATFQEHLTATGRAIKDYLKEVQEKRQIDTSADSQASVVNEAVRDLITLWGQIDNTVALLYPVANADPHVTRLGDDTNFRHDPGQVAIVHPVTNQPQAVPPDEVDGYRKMGYSVPGEKEAVRRATQHHEDLEAAARRLPRNTPAEAAPSA